MTRKALLTLALWLTALLALAAPGQAASRHRRHHHYGHHHRHHSHRNYGRGLHSRKKSVGHYLPPNLAIAPSGGKPSEPVQRGHPLTVYVGPFQPEYVKDKMTVRVSYLYQLMGQMSWTHGAITTLTFDNGHKGSQKAGELLVGADWQQLIILTESSETYNGINTSNYVSGRSVRLTSVRGFQGDEDDYLRHHHRLRPRSHYNPPNSR